MLQLRRTKIPSVRGFLGSPFFAIGDRLLGVDPGLLRLTIALRGTLTTAIATTLAIIIGHYAHLSPAVFANGVVLSLMGPFLMREPTLPQQRRTLLFLLIPSLLATAATAVLHAQPLAGEGFFLLLVFLGYLFQPRAPRMIGIGLVAVITTYIGLFLQLPAALLPFQLLSPLIAVVVVAIVCLVALPITPATTLRRAVRAVQLRAAQVLKSARQLTRGGALSPAEEAMLRRDLARLNEAVLAADDQLTFVEPDGRDAMRASLIDLELAAARFIDAMRAGAPDRRDRLRLQLHLKRMSKGRRYSLPASSLEAGSLLACLVELGHALHRLGVAAKKANKQPLLPPPAALPPGPLGWRIATRITLAAAMAMAGGLALSPHRWFWAVITVYVVFLNTRSRGDTIYKAAQRIAGTMLGITAGMLLGEAMGNHVSLQLAVLLLSVFGMFYFYVVSYTIGVFCVTMMLGMIYGTLGEPVEALFVLRLEETALGAAAAIFVAFFIMPARTRDQVMASGRNVLLALADALKATRQVVTKPGEGPSPDVAMRKVDRQVADLRLSLAPLVATRRLFRRNALERPVPILLDCVHSTRLLVAASRQPSDTLPGDALLQRMAAVEARLRTLAGSSIEALRSMPIAIDSSTEPEAAADPGAEGGLDAPLHRLEKTLAILTERLQIGALEGFALDG
jgi:uncharacterized membrane protein YccC